MTLITGQIVIFSIHTALPRTNENSPERSIGHASEEQSRTHISGQTKIVPTSVPNSLEKIGLSEIGTPNFKPNNYRN